MSYATAANGLRHREIARLKSYAIPPVAAMQSLTHGQFRERIAELMQGLGHEVVILHLLTICDFENVWKRRVRRESRVALWTVLVWARQAEMACLKTAKSL